MRPRINAAARSRNFSTENVVVGELRPTIEKGIMDSILWYFIFNNQAIPRGQLAKELLFSVFGAEHVPPPLEVPQAPLSLEDKKTIFYRNAKASFKAIKKAALENYVNKKARENSQALCAA